MHIYVNGHIIPEEEAVISPFDHGFMYGVGAFETFRTYNSRPFLFADHLRRLERSVDILGIRFKVSEDKLLPVVSDLLSVNNTENASVRLNVSAGPATSNLQSEPYDNPGLIIYMRHLPGHFPDEKSIHILKMRRNTPETAYRIKSHHFLNNIIGKREMASEPGKEGLFLSENGFVAECVTSNIFWCKKNTVYTPAVETGILNGITRQFIIELCNKLDINCETGLFAKEHLLSADEVFMTNSVQEIVPIKQIDEYDFPGKEGQVTCLFKKWYHHYREQQLPSIRELTKR